jgi:hypothetical protein
MQIILVMGFTVKTLVTIGTVKLNYKVLRKVFHLQFVICDQGPPLWSSGQRFWLQIQRSRVRFPALPDFLSSSGSGTGSTQPCEPPEVN